MRKLFVAGIIVLGFGALTSCKKDYACMVNSMESGQCLSCTKTQKKAFETTCAAIGGTVQEK